MAKIWKLKTEIPEDVLSDITGFLISASPTTPSRPPEADGTPLLEKEGMGSKLVAQLLYDRGLTDADKIKEFLDVKYEKLHDPFIFKDMERAVSRIWQAIEKYEPITIYGDYDADAVTANAVLQQAFRHLGVEVRSYIPDRFTEGYGINIEALEKIRDQGSKIIITVDCGTNSVDAAEFCSANGIDLIITDHHEIIGEPPLAYALINPKNPLDKYPDPNITGVGVAFKVACALLSQKEKVASRFEPSPPTPLPKGEGGRKLVEGYEKWLLDLVAIGTVADCHSLLGENRILVKYGLKVLQKTKWAGLKALMEVAKVDPQKNVDTYTLGFVIAPRLNAAGRLEHADSALHLLMAQDPSVAIEKANQLEEINKRRQDQTARIVSEAKEQALLIKDRKVIIVHGEGWNRGIVGLVAGRLVEEYKRPVIVMEKGETESTGSARTVGEFNLVESLKHASQHLVRFGGHKQAAGLTLKTAEFQEFYQKILEYAEINLTEEDLEYKLVLDAELEDSDLSLATCNLLQQLEPFGVGNPKPRFLISQMKIISSRQVGATKQHAQLQLQKGGKNISAIAFNFNPLEKNFNVGDTIDVAAELIADEWNGRKEVKLRIIDLKIHSNILAS